MAIIFHCDHCGKKIEAQEKVAGKWGKCPSCHNKIYVPNLNVNADDLKLAPVDEETKKRKKKLMAETFAVEQEILDDRETPDKSAKQETSALSASLTDEDRLYENIVRYLRQMADGRLEEAALTLDLIKVAGEIALKHIDRIALADIPEAELADVPSQVTAGLIRTLRSQIA